MKLVSTIFLIVVATNAVAYTDTEVAKMLLDDPHYADEFGYSVAIDGDTAVIGKPAQTSTSSAASAAYVYVRNSVGEWALQAELSKSIDTGAAGFGKSVAIQGNTIVVGEPNSSNVYPGYVYVFERIGVTWIEQAVLSDSTGEASRFGFSVDIDADTIVAGDPDADHLGSGFLRGQGAVYVFVRDGGTWVQQQMLIAVDGDEGDRFGWSVAIDRDTVVVGDSRDDEVAEDSGSAYIFRRSGLVWSQQAKIFPSDGFTNDHFGWSVAVDNDKIAIGSIGVDPFAMSPEMSRDGIVFIYSPSAGTWIEETRLTAHDFGWSVDIQGDTLIVGGATGVDEEFGGVVGEIYQYNFARGVWYEQARFIASGPGVGGVGDTLGRSVALDGTTIVAGDPYFARAPGDFVCFRFPISLHGCGAAYIFEIDIEGPLTFYTIADPHPALVGFPVSVSALVTDEDTGGSVITDAYLTIDRLGVGSLLPEDGAFDETGEFVVGDFFAASIDDVGFHEICVNGRDEARNTGALTCYTLEIIPADADSDGVLDDIDACLMTEPGATTRVDGCSVTDLCPCTGGWTNHGDYMGCIVHTANEFQGEGLIRGSEFGRLVSAAARSSCGK